MFATVAYGERRGALPRRPAGPPARRNGAYRVRGQQPPSATIPPLPSLATIPAIGPPGEPLDRLLEALNAVGWVVDLRQPVAASGSNPTRVDLRHAQDTRRLLLYSWFVTHEGKGRAKNDFRIQTTRTHEGPLTTDHGRVTVGIGWDRRREVFAAFDGWAKRQTGGSSSVHIKAALLERARTEGWAVDPPRWDARVAFDRANAGRFLSWIGEMSGLRQALLNPVDYTIHDSDHADIVGDIWAGQPPDGCASAIGWS